MQTFLPVADFDESARLLDSPRLGKQRVETLQVLRALELPDYGWANHPAVLMWRGRTAGAGRLRAGDGRGSGGSAASPTPPTRQIAEFAPDVAGTPQDELAAAGLLPSWVGDEALHRSHRSNLIAKDPDFYRPRFAELFGPEPDDLPYVWPEPTTSRPRPAPDGVRVWVVRPRAHNELGACLAAGVVGLGTQSGIDVDATGLRPAELRALSKELSGTPPGQGPAPAVGLPRRDGARATRSRCRSSTAPGCCSARWSGDYLFQGRELLPHRRPARWDRVVPRSAARPPATLQDPRALFRVVLDPARARLGRQAPGSGTFCSRTWPRATSLPSSARVSTTCHSCRVRPCWIGSATTSSRPAVIGRRKSVLLLTPTANWPRSSDRGAGPDAGRRLDDRAVDAAVHDAPRACAGRARARRCPVTRVPLDLGDLEARSPATNALAAVRSTVGQVGAHASHTRQKGWPTGSA